MILTDCVWELANIGKRTCEVVVEKNDILDHAFFQDLDSKYEYQVIKVTPGNIKANYTLEDNGFHLIETQIELEMKYKDICLDDMLIKYIERDTSFLEVKENKELEEILERITPNMFVTDRIALDPLFGYDFSCKRYKNWMKTAFLNKTASFLKMFYKNEHVGFIMYRIKGSIWYGYLSGIYDGVDQGLGLLTACGGLIYMKKNEVNIKTVVTAISSNNTPVVPITNHCHYNFKGFKYVFVKHNDVVL